MVYFLSTGIQNSSPAEQFLNLGRAHTGGDESVGEAGKGQQGGERTTGVLIPTLQLFHTALR